MTVITVHELCREQLRHALSKRYMPTGWCREGERKVALRFNDASKYLDGELATVSDDLVVRPEHAPLQQLLARAAQARTAKEVVVQFVKEIRALPVPEQGDAYAVTELRSRMIYLDQMRSVLTEAREKIAAKLRDSGVRGVDFPEILSQLDDAAYQTGCEYRQVEANLAAYEKAL